MRFETLQEFQHLSNGKFSVSSSLHSNCLGMFLRLPGKTRHCSTFWMRSNDSQIQLSNGNLIVSSASYSSHSSSYSSFIIQQIVQNSSLVIVNSFNKNLMETSICIWNFCSNTNSTLSTAGQVDQIVSLGKLVILRAQDQLYSIEITPKLLANSHSSLDLTQLVSFASAQFIVSTDSHLFVLDAGKLEIFDKFLKPLGNCKIGEQIDEFSVDSFGDCFILATVSINSIFTLYKLEIKGKLEALHSVDLKTNAANDSTKERWNLSRVRVLDNHVIILLSSANENSTIRFLQCEVEEDTKSELVDHLLENCEKILDFYKDDDSHLKVLSFDRVSKLVLFENEESAEWSLLNELAQVVDKEVILKHYGDKYVKDQISNQRSTQDLIIDQLLRSFSFNPIEMFPPSSGEKLDNLIQTIVENEDFSTEQKFAILYYIVSPTSSASNFVALVGLDECSINVVQAYRFFDNGQYLKAVNLLCQSETVDFPFIILETLIKKQLFAEVQKFVRCFKSKIEFIPALMELDFDYAMNYAASIRANTEFIEAIFKRNMQKSNLSHEMEILILELLHYITDDEFQSALEKYVVSINNAQLNEFYGIFLISRGKFKSSQKYLEFSRLGDLLEHDVSDAYFHEYTSTYRPKFPVVNPNDSVSSPPLQRPDLEPQKKNYPLRRNQAFLFNSLSPFSPPKPKNIRGLPIVELPLPEPSMMEVPVLERYQSHNKSKRKDLLSDETNVRAPALIERAAKTPKLATSEKKDQKKIDQEKNIERPTLQQEETHDRGMEKPVFNNEETTGSWWLGKISSWLTPFKTNQDKRMRSTSSEITSMKFTNVLLFIQDSIEKRPKAKEEVFEDTDVESSDEHDKDEYDNNSTENEENENEDEVLQIQIKKKQSPRKSRKPQHETVSQWEDGVGITRLTRSAYKKKEKREDGGDSKSSSAPGSITATPMPNTSVARSKQTVTNTTRRTVGRRSTETPQQAMERTPAPRASKRHDMNKDNDDDDAHDRLNEEDYPYTASKLPARRMITRSMTSN